MQLSRLEARLETPITVEGHNFFFKYFFLLYPFHFAFDRSLNIDDADAGHVVLELQTPPSIATFIIPSSFAVQNVGEE